MWLQSAIFTTISVAYRDPVTGTRSRGIVHRQSLWLADMWHAY